MDIEHIRELVALMVENDLSRIDIRDENSHVILRRGQAPVLMPSQPTWSPPQAVAPPAATVASSGASAPSVSSGGESSIRSPMVGTFYAAADPNSPAFVKVGDVVHANTVVCIIEAMKVFNEIKAETEGRIARVLVKNGEAVEYDQPLFAIEPA